MPDEQPMPDGPRRTKRSEYIGDDDLRETGVQHVKVHPQSGPQGRESPFVSRAAGDLASDAEMVHEMTRSEKAQHADESFNAPLAETYNQWLEHPNRYDLSGVDTIPKDRHEARARRMLDLALDAGFVGEAKVGDPERDKRNTGRFSATKPATVAAANKPFKTEVSVADEGTLDEVRGHFGDFDRHSLGNVLAHEVGHAVDFGLGEGGLVDESYASDEILSTRADVEPPEGYTEREYVRLLNEEAIAVSRRVRGQLSDREYQESQSELSADAFAAMTLEPRAFRREAPHLSRLYEERIRTPLERGG